MTFTEPIFRPPQESRSIIIRGTQGCTYNKCLFCNLCKKSKFMMTSAEMLETHLKKISSCQHRSLPVFLSGANPFAMSFERLKKLALVIRKYLPNCPYISMHTRIDDIARKSDKELHELHMLGVDNLYPGTENGNPDVMALMNKGATVEDSIIQLARLREAGICFTANYIIGMGGKGMGKASGRMTAELFNKTHPMRVTTTGMTVFADTELHEMRRQGKYTMAPETENVHELREFLSHLTVETIVDTRHYLNVINLEIKMPEQKDKALQSIDLFLRDNDEEQIQDVYKREMFVAM